MPDDCIFCAIVAGSIPAQVVRRDERSIAIRDVNPQAPVHVLVMPHEHVESADTLRDAELWWRLLTTVQAVAEAEGLREGGYRIVANVGREGGQTVGHLHLHVLGGRQMTWPPG